MHIPEHDIKRIESAIAEAERETSGEIRLYIEKKCDKPETERAREIFVQLEMHKTALHNGVLFYIALDSRKIAVWGDEAIHQKVSQKFWEEIIAEMIPLLHDLKFAEAFSNAVKKTGKELQKYFPFHHEDINELENHIIFGD